MHGAVSIGISPSYSSTIASVQAGSVLNQDRDRRLLAQVLVLVVRLGSFLSVKHVLRTTRDVCILPCRPNALLLLLWDYSDAFTPSYRALSKALSQSLLRFYLLRVQQHRVRPAVYDAVVHPDRLRMSVISYRKPDR